MLDPRGVRAGFALLNRKDTRFRRGCEIASTPSNLSRSSPGLGSMSPRRLHSIDSNSQGRGLDMGRTMPQASILGTGNGSDSFGALQREFFQAAVRDIDELAALLESLKNGLDEKSAVRFRKLAHDLRGSGGSYGFDGISARAGELEEALLAGTAIGELAATLVELEKEAHAAIAKVGLPRGEAALPKTVLYAEDDRFSALLVRHVLEEKGSRVEIVETGKEFLGRIGRSPKPHAAILDLVLPDMGGLEVLDRMKRVPVLSPIPVVVLSAREADRAQALGRGAAAFCPKPFDPSALETLLAGLLDERRSDC